MDVWQMLGISGASFAGSWAALLVHVKYLRRDVDHAHKRLDLHDERLNKAHI